MSGWGDNDLKTLIVPFAQPVWKTGPSIFLNKELIVFLPTMMKTRVGLNAGVHPHYLSRCECEGRGRKERFLPRSVLPLGHPWPSM